jgi:SAM-dependent methyltransferase
MISARVRNLQEYLLHRKNNARIYKKIQQLEEEMPKNKGREFTVKGYSYPAKAEVKFKVDYLYSDNVHINWRERLICPITQLNNRLRASVHFMDFELGVKDYSKIYIAEQLTPLYSYLQKKYRNVTGSEFLGASVKGGYVNEKGIRHEDATNFSFENGEFDYYLTFECFEHIPDFMKTFQESYRILKDDGMMFWTVPFANLSHENIIRAKVLSDGSIEHILPAEYHGDPVHPDKGVLCYQYFGWEMFDQLKTIGFKDAYAITYWCDALGYYGGEQFLFCAVK